jgi:hypothetical protein
LPDTVEEIIRTSYPEPLLANQDPWYEKGRDSPGRNRRLHKNTLLEGSGENM